MITYNSMKQIHVVIMVMALIGAGIGGAFILLQPAGDEHKPAVPVDVYVVIGNVEGVAEGVYKYAPHEHELVKVRDGNVRDEMAVAAVGQTWVGEGAIIIVFSAVYERTTQKYGDRGIRYVHMEVGHAAQNVYLQAVSLNLGTAVVGAFDDEEVRKILNMSDEEDPLYIVPVGKI